MNKRREELLTLFVLETGKTIARPVNMSGPRSDRIIKEYSFIPDYLKESV